MVCFGLNASLLRCINLEIVKAFLRFLPLTSGLHIGVVGVFVLVGIEGEIWTGLALYQ